MDEEDGGKFRRVTNRCSACERDARKDTKSETAKTMDTGR